MFRVARVITSEQVASVELAPALKLVLAPGERYLHYIMKDGKKYAELQFEPIKNGAYIHWLGATGGFGAHPEFSHSEIISIFKQFKKLHPEFKFIKAERTGGVRAEERRKVKFPLDSRKLAMDRPSRNAHYFIQWLKRKKLPYDGAVRPFEESFVYVMLPRLDGTVREDGSPTVQSLSVCFSHKPKPADLLVCPGHLTPIEARRAVALKVREAKRQGLICVDGKWLHEAQIKTAASPAVAPTQNPAFQAWFGGSKVVNDDGTPKRVYHGTRYDFSSFDTDKQYPEALYGPGFYFTEDSGVAGGNGRFGDNADIDDIMNAAAWNQAGYAWQGAEYSLAPLDKKQLAYAKRLFLSKYVQNACYEDIGSRRFYKQGWEALNEGEEPFRKWLAKEGPRWMRMKLYKMKEGDPRQMTTQPNVVPVYLDITNPADMDAPVSQDDVERIATTMEKLGIAVGEKFRVSQPRNFADALTQSGLKKPDYQRVLKSMGYDGITHIGGNIVGSKDHRVWIAFNPTQIKSAIGNSGTYDPANPNIIASKTAAVEQWNEKNIVAHVGSYRIAVNMPNDATYVTAWTEDNKKVGVLSLKSTIPGEGLRAYAGIDYVEVDRKHQKRGLGMAMYRVALQHMNPRWKGLKSYLPDRVNKRAVPVIWKRLGGYEWPDNSDYMVIDRPQVKTAATKLDAKTVARIRQIRSEVRLEEIGEDVPESGQCGIVSECLNQEFGWSMDAGFYLEPGKMHNGHGDHVWNVLKDGTIVDGTHDQFGAPDIAVIPPNAPGREKYHSYCGNYDCPICTCKECNEGFWEDAQKAKKQAKITPDDRDFYHGTTFTFDKLKPNRKGLIWLTDDRQVAQEYADDKMKWEGEQARLLWVTLRDDANIIDIRDLSNPMVQELRNKLCVSLWNAKHGKETTYENNPYVKLPETEPTPEQLALIPDNQYRGNYEIIEQYRWVLPWLRSKGIDAIICNDTGQGSVRNHESVAVLNPDIIEQTRKTASGNLLLSDAEEPIRGVDFAVYLKDAEGKTWGHLYALNDDGWLRPGDVLIDPFYRNQRWGRAMYSHLLSVAKRNGLKGIKSGWGVSPSARRVWDSLNAETDPETGVLYKTAAEDWAPWIGCDLDGTLAKDLPEFNPKAIGEPIPAMVEKIKKAIADGKTVKVLTARMADKENAEKIAKLIAAWTKKHVGTALEATNEKDPGMEEIWDDKARGVEKNKGEFKTAAVTDTPAFKAWFKGSKIVDAEGNPLRCYHGTGANIEQFKYEFTNRGRDQFGSGFYFTDDPTAASGYASERTISDEPKPGGEQANVVPVYLAIRKPIHVKDGEAIESPLTTAQVSRIIQAAPDLDNALSNFGDVEYEGKSAILNQVVSQYADADLLYQLTTLANDFFPHDVELFNKAVNKVAGYDGYVANGIYVAWFPNQIKSAIGNNGQFDPKNPNITAARKVQPFPNSKIQDVMYHGTSAPFSRVVMSKGTQGVFWVTSNRERLEQGEVGANSTKCILGMYIDVQNPAGWEQYEKKSLGELKRDGYDSVVLPDDENSFDVILFKPNQVRIIGQVNKTAATDEEERAFAEQFPDEHAYLKHHNTGFIAPDSYDNFWKQQKSWQKPERYPKLLRTVTLKDGSQVEFRQSEEKNKYVQQDANGEIVRDAQGLATYMSDEDVEKAGHPLYNTTILAFNDKGECVGQASDEWGADGIWVRPDYQQKGLGVQLLADFRRQFKKVRQIGQMTPAGQQLVRNYYRSLTGKEPTPVPDESTLQEQAQRALWRFFANTNPDKVPEKFKPAYENLLHLSDNVKLEEAPELFKRVQEWFNSLPQKDWVSPTGLNAITKTAASAWTQDELKNWAGGFQNDNHNPGDPGYGEVDEFNWKFEPNFPVAKINGPEMDTNEWKQWWEQEKSYDPEFESPRYAPMEQWYKGKPDSNDPVIIAEGTDNKFHIWDGYHRVALCHYHGHSTVPAIVGYRKKTKTAAAPMDNAQFKAWFSGSKVVDEQGNPLRCYHGTKSGEDFDEFSVDGRTSDDNGEYSTSGSGADPTSYMGAHFAQETQVANSFAMGTKDWMRSRYDGENERPRVIPVYLSIKNPKDFGSEHNLRNFIFQGNIRDEEVTNIPMQADGIDPWGDDDEAVMEWANQYDTNTTFRVEQNQYIFESYRPQEGEDELIDAAAQELASDAKSRLEQQGYDGVRYKNVVEGGVSWIAFHPNQIKSAIGNAGTYDPQQNSITASVGTYPTYEQFVEYMKRQGVNPELYVETNYNRLREAHLKLSDPLTLYRAITVMDGIDDIDSHVGVYWAHELAKARPYWPGDEDESAVTLCAKVPSSSVDWLQTMHSDLMGSPGEINLKSGAPLTLVKYSIEDPLAVQQGYHSEEWRRIPANKKNVVAAAAPKYFYHCTLAENLDSIAKQGLKPSTDPHWGGMLGDESQGKVFFTDKPDKALYYGFVLFKGKLEQGEASIPLVLRVRMPQGVVPQHGQPCPNGYIEEYWTEQPIPPQNIEVFWHKWEPLKPGYWSEMTVRWSDEDPDASMYEEGEEIPEYEGGYVDWEGEFIGTSIDDVLKDIKATVTPSRGRTAAVPPTRKMFHVSRKKNRASIEAQGLQPRIQEFGDIERKAGVYLLETYDQALDWCYWFGSGEVVNKTMDIWEVTLPDGVEVEPETSKDFTDIYDAWVCYQTIPPQNLRVVKTMTRYGDPPPKAQKVVRASGVSYVYAEPDFMDDDSGFDFEDLAAQAYKLAQDNHVGILSDKRPYYYAVADDRVVGAVFVTNSNDHFSFDVVVDPASRNKGIGTKLTQKAEQEYSMVSEAYDDYKYKVDVINPAMKKLLEGRGFHVIQPVGENRWLMGK